jgi:hypothetical protein
MLPLYDLHNVELVPELERVFEILHTGNTVHIPETIVDIISEYFVPFKLQILSSFELDGLNYDYIMNDSLLAVGNKSDHCTFYSLEHGEVKDTLEYPSVSAKNHLQLLFENRLEVLECDCGESVVYTVNYPWTLDRSGVCSWESRIHASSYGYCVRDECDKMRGECKYYLVLSEGSKRLGKMPMSHEELSNITQIALVFSSLWIFGRTNILEYDLPSLRQKRCIDVTVDGLRKFHDPIGILFPTILLFSHHEDCQDKSFVFFVNFLTNESGKIRAREAATNGCHLALFSGSKLQICKTTT